MKTIHLHGTLADQFGEFFKLDVNSTGEAVHAIACQIPAFKAFMMRAEQDGMDFAIFEDTIDEQGNIGESDLINYTNAATIHIVPRVMGAGGDAFGWLQVIAGTVLVGVGMYFGIQPLIGMGVGLILGGAASLLMPMPEMQDQSEDGNRPNYGFGGAVTTVGQGNPVPILYGERYIGGFICSAGIYTEDTQ